MDEKCANCRYRHYDREMKDWFCGNQDSDNYTDFVEKEGGCDEWEEK